MAPFIRLHEFSKSLSAYDWRSTIVQLLRRTSLRISIILFLVLISCLSWKTIFKTSPYPKDTFSKSAQLSSVPVEPIPTIARVLYLF